MPPPPPRSLQPSAPLLVVLLVALAVGAAASLLIGAAIGPSGPPPPGAELVLPGSYFILGLWVFLGALVASVLYQRLSSRSSASSNRLLVTTLVTVLVAVAFLAAMRAWGGAGPSSAGEVSPGQNSTGTIPPGGNLTNASGTGNMTAFYFPGLPSWLPFVLLVAAILVVAFIAVPAIGRFLVDRRVGRPPTDRDAAEAQGVEETLRGASRALEQGGDPRAVIVGLYSDLLLRLGPIIGSVEPETPEEIRRGYLLRLGIRPGAATELTRLFEEARYSSHPLGPGEAERARHALDAAVEDLSHRSEEE